MDPNDINNSYDDIERLFKLGAVGGTPPPVTNPAVLSAEKTTPPAKQTFEVMPDAVFDGPSVGRQPAYNILRSGPPAEKDCNRPSWRSNSVYYGSDEGPQCEYSSVYIVLIFIVLLLILLHTRMQLLQTESLIKLLLLHQRQSPQS
ncbi:hypothetical protein PI125_g19875 [Phytophthora idaei]|nr:hypothetical protein PI125_g19875 [Phytophthora idaei]